MKIITFLVILLLTMSCSSTKRASMPSDIHTEVMLNGKEIIVANRNVGAKRAGKKGSYLTWKKAMKACPKGYHLMTKSESWEILTDAKYNTREKLMKGELKMPPAGFIPYDKKGSIIKDESVLGCYHLADNFDDSKKQS